MRKTIFFTIVLFVAAFVGSFYLTADKPSGLMGVVVDEGHRSAKKEKAAANSESQTMTPFAAVEIPGNILAKPNEDILAPAQYDSEYSGTANESEILKMLPEEDGLHRPVESAVNTLWETDSNINPFPDDDIENIEPVRTDPEFLANLQVGQVLEFFVPQLGESFQGVIDTTSNQMGGVKIWKGSLQDEDDKSNVLISQGESMTHIVLTTTKGVYAVQIDNKSGEGAVIDEREYTGKTVDIDDGIPFDQHSDVEIPFNG